MITENNPNFKEASGRMSAFVQEEEALVLVRPIQMERTNGICEVENV